MGTSSPPVKPKRCTVPVVYVPGTRVLLLSRPTKMPCPSWSLPAGPSCPFMVTGENTICGSCFAMKGQYVSDPDMVYAQKARFHWTLECMKSAAGQKDWIKMMTLVIGSIKYDYFRVHDSGDLFSPTYTRCWYEVCRTLDHLTFWFPTRSWRAPWVVEIQRLNSLPNVTVRPSALHFGAEPPEILGLSAGTTAIKEGYSCPAPRQGNHCGDCRVCWDAPESPVSYHAH